LQCEITLRETRKRSFIVLRHGEGRGREGFAGKIVVRRASRFHSLDWEKGKRRFLGAGGEREGNADFADLRKRGEKREKKRGTYSRLIGKICREWLTPPCSQQKRGRVFGVL